MIFWNSIYSCGVKSEFMRFKPANTVSICELYWEAWQSHASSMFSAAGGETIDLHVQTPLIFPSGGGRVVCSW